jgi:hypothetical protein
VNLFGSLYDLNKDAAKYLPAAETTETNDLSVTVSGLPDGYKCDGKLIKQEDGMFQLSIKQGEKEAASIAFNADKNPTPTEVELGGKKYAITMSSDKTILTFTVKPAEVVAPATEIIDTNPEVLQKFTEALSKLKNQNEDSKNPTITVTAKKNIQVVADLIKTKGDVTKVQSVIDTLIKDGVSGFQKELKKQPLDGVVGSSDMKVLLTMAGVSETDIPKVILAKAGNENKRVKKEPSVTDPAAKQEVVSQAAKDTAKKISRNFGKTPVMPIVTVNDTIQSIQ